MHVYFLLFMLVTYLGTGGCGRAIRVSYHMSICKRPIGIEGGYAGRMGLRPVWVLVWGISYLLGWVNGNGNHQAGEEDTRHWSQE